MRILRYFALPAIIALFVVASVRASDTAGDLTTIVAHEDFLNGTGGSIFSQNSAGAGSNGGAQADAEQGRPGILEIATGWTAAGRGSIITGAARSVLFGGGEWTCDGDVDVLTIANAVDDYVLRFGFVDSYQLAAPTDGAWIEYNQGVSPNWLMRSASNGNQTTTYSAVAVTTGWHRHKQVVNAAGTAVEFFLDNTSIGFVTTDIPTTAGRVTGIGAGIFKTAGLASRAARIDWIDIKVTLTNSR